MKIYSLLSKFFAFRSENSVKKDSLGGNHMLEIINFSKTYKGGKKAVDQLNITVQAGDIFGFIGHNGAGKVQRLSR